LNFKDLSYKKKCQYLLGGALLLGVVAYMAAFNNTIRLYMENNVLEAKLERAAKAPSQVLVLESALEAIDDQLSYYIIDTLKNHETTLEIVSEFCFRNRLILKELPKKEVMEEEDFTIETSILSVEGNYKDLLRLVYELEQKHKIGRLSSVSFRLFKDNHLKKHILVLTIYIQNIRINNGDPIPGKSYEKI
jgi:hypothetical protein